MTQQTMKEIVLAAIEANKAFMDSKGADLLEPLWTIFGEAVIAIKNCSAPALDSDDDDDHTLLLMCCNALSDSFAALMSVRQGFIRPPAIVMRGVVENLAAVVTFLADDEAFKKFKEDRYDLPKAIGPSKKHFPELAQHYGILTNSFTHETVASIGRTLGKDKGIFFVPKLDGGHLGKGQVLLLSIIGTIAHNIGQIVEFCFIRYLATPTLWERIDAEHIQMKITEGRKLIGFLTKRLEESLAISEPGSH